MLLLIWSVCLLVAGLLYMQQAYRRFSRCGVKTLPPLPIFGNFASMLFKRKHFSEDLETLYDAFPNERFVGRFEFLKPVVMIRDVELFKKIAIKDFEYFLDHRVLIDKDKDPLFGRNMFSMKGQEWKDMRSTLSPAFTSSKIRAMVPFMVEVGNQMIKALMKKIEASKDGYIEVEMKDLTNRYANDVIASCAFGIKVDSHTDEDNDFFKMGLEASQFKFRQTLIFFAYSSVPRLASFLKLNLFEKRVQNFFRALVSSTMQNREKHNIIRPDMIHLLMEAKKGHISNDDKIVDEDAGFATVKESAIGKRVVNRAWSDDDLTAQAILFFVGGFDTVSSNMTFLMYELAINPDVQDRLAREIKEHDEKNNGKFDFNSIQSLVYLDMVVCELMRVWTAGIAHDRICNKDYNLGRPNDKATEDFIVRKGEGIMIPAWSIHHDPQYYPNPLKFDPERFSEENKHKIKPFTYLPFGIGPRNCIGSRFALCEMKVMAYQLLRHIEVFPSPRTQIPAKLDKSTFNLRIEGGHWLRLKVRN